MATAAPPTKSATKNIRVCIGNPETLESMVVAAGLEVETAERIGNGFDLISFLLARLPEDEARKACEYLMATARQLRESHGGPDLVPYSEMPIPGQRCPVCRKATVVGGTCTFCMHYIDGQVTDLNDPIDEVRVIKQR